MIEPLAAAVAVWTAIYWPSIRRRKVSISALIALTALVAVALGILRKVRG